ncbi:ABC transporter ATP-binding protein [Nakamurella aerolata]|uniref:ABC transporter ATP-binding protein n=1 Tax=Nakamurella aerolata TaxID=1656892 RepID=A0A849AA68_9ACTN|nr:ABC transporter ATP-binding protein [Nakamurella aerolata]NNG37419.1 ABC transporter ATP-binding protein [Nakamurella aerolata]
MTLSVDEVTSRAGTAAELRAAELVVYPARSGDRGPALLRGVSMTARPAGVTGLIGPNGAGKTTLLRSLAGLQPISSGEVLLGARPLHRVPRRQRARLLALLQQQAETELPLAVLDVVLLGRIPHRGRWQPVGDRDTTVAAQALRAVGMESFAERRWASLSGGERQRVQLARALAQQPEVLLLDEPTNHLDLRAQWEILALARDSGRTVIAALHDLNLAAAFCDHLVVLEHGTVAAAGPPAEILSAGLVEQVYGVRPEVLHTAAGRPVFAPPAP